MQFALNLMKFRPESWLILWVLLCINCSLHRCIYCECYIKDRAWPIHRQHSPYVHIYIHIYIYILCFFTYLGVFQSYFLLLCHWISFVFFFTTEVSAVLHPFDRLSLPHSGWVSGFGVALLSTDFWSQMRNKSAYGTEISIQVSALTKVWTSNLSSWVYVWIGL